MMETCIAAINPARFHFGHNQWEICFLYGFSELYNIALLLCSQPIAKANTTELYNLSTLFCFTFSFCSSGYWIYQIVRYQVKLKY